MSAYHSNNHVINEIDFPVLGTADTAKSHWGQQQKMSSDKKETSPAPPRPLPLGTFLGHQQGEKGKRGRGLPPTKPSIFLTAPNGINNKGNQV